MEDLSFYNVTIVRHLEVNGCSTVIIYYFDKVEVHHIPNIYQVIELKDIFDLELTLDIMVDKKYKIQIIW